MSNYAQAMLSMLCATVALGVIAAYVLDEWEPRTKAAEEAKSWVGAAIFAVLGYVASALLLAVL